MPDHGSVSSRQWRGTIRLMATLVLTVIGDDRAGLVDALAGPIAAHDGNWDRSHMARLAGKFAGIVVVSVPDERTDALTAELRTLAATGPARRERGDRFDRRPRAR